MKPVHLVIENPEGIGPWLYRSGENSQGENATIIYKIRGDGGQADHTKLLLALANKIDEQATDKVLEHLNKLGLEESIPVADIADKRLKQPLRKQVTDRFLEDVLKERRQLPENLSVEIVRQAPRQSGVTPETKPVKAKGFSLKHFLFGGKSPSARNGANETRQAAAQVGTVLKTGFRGFLELFRRKTVPIPPESNTELSINQRVSSARPDLAPNRSEQTPDSAPMERKHEFDPGYMNLSGSDLQREVRGQVEGDQQRERYRRHLRDAVAIQESLWVTRGTGKIDQTLDVTSLDDILVTLRSALKLDLSPDAKQSINVLGKAVSYYKQMQKNKTPGP